MNCLPGCLTKVLFLMSHLFVSISTGFSNACIVKRDITILKMHECLWFTIIRLCHQRKKAIVHWEESGWNLNVFFKCNFICSQVLWKSLHWNLFCSSPLFHFPVRKLLFGSILGVISVSFSLFPPVNAMPSKNGFTPHVLRDGGCFHFYPLLKMERTAQLTF